MEKTGIGIGLFMAIILIIYFGSCYRYEIFRLNLEFREEPLRSLKLPLKNINGIHTCGSPYICNNYKSVMLIRLVDFDNKEYYLGLIWSGNENKVTTIIKNLPLSWLDDRSNFSGIQLPDNVDINDIINGKHHYEKIEDVDGTILDILYLHEKFGCLQSPDGYSGVAFNYLKEHHNGVKFFLRKHIAKYILR